jgi:tRNA A37 threonylcarbamoyltransferase TsaD
MVVGFTTTCVISVYHHCKVVGSNHVNGKVYSIQIYVIKFVSDLQQVSGGHRGCDCMVVGFITTYAISTYHH